VLVTKGDKVLACPPPLLCPSAGPAHVINAIKAFHNAFNRIAPGKTNKTCGRDGATCKGHSWAKWVQPQTECLDHPWPENQA
jgi:hypothetical protein